MEQSEQQQATARARALRASLHEINTQNNAASNHLRASFLMRQSGTAAVASLPPAEHYYDDTTTGGGNDYTYHDMSSYDDDDEEDYSDSEHNNLDDDSFGPAGSASSSSNAGIITPQQQTAKKEKNRVAAVEHQRVFRARIFVLLLLAGTAVANAVIVYFLTRNREYEDYDQHYNQLANEIMQVTRENVRVSFVGLEAMSSALTTQVLDDAAVTGSLAWPLVTFDDYATLSADVRNLTGAVQIVFVPIVAESQRLDWETYSVDHHEWVRQQDPLDYHQRRQRRQRRRALLFNSTNTNTSSSTILPFMVPQQHKHMDPIIGDELNPRQDLRWKEEQTVHKHQANKINRQSASAPQSSKFLQNHQLPKQPKQKQRQLHQESDFRGVIPSRIHPAPTREERLTPGMQYAPVWQMSPPPYYRDIINHDMEREASFQRLTQHVLQTRQGVISNQLNDELVPLLLEDHINENNPSAEVAEENHNHRHYPAMSLLLQPIWESFELQATRESAAAGYLIALIPWSAYLRETFRSTSDATVLAQYEYAESTACIDGEEPSGDLSSPDEWTNQQLLNYQVGGGMDVEFLGEGENFRSKSKFDFSMKLTMEFPLELSFAQISSTIMLAESNKNNGTVDDANNNPEGNDDSMATQQQQPTTAAHSECGILRLHIYPSEELRNIYITTYPAYYAALVLLVFLILGAAFFIYNFFVEKRRGRVMAVAEKTGRIVLNLFPSHFADQMIAENKKKEKAAKKKKRVVIQEAPNRQLKKFIKDKDQNSTRNLNSMVAMNGGTSSGQADHLGYGEGAPDTDDSPLFLAQSKPIADLFPETTVLFADIAGFTAWSSVREPSQVFTLLETVYQNFDFLAKQYGIFKIETIGDCYVAVCGLPEPRVDHAVAMSRFAIACMQKMKVLVSQLELTLGPDTADLTMRFGLHSGPVTAGVLRGERARFQLFGDTVNTAARMESTGLRDKIQISQETADLLTAAGKTHWITKRDGLVKAKGKGELQTYWLSTSGSQRRQSMAGSAGNGRRYSVGGPVERRVSVGGAGAAGGEGGRRASIGRRTSIGARAPNQRDLSNKSLGASRHTSEKALRPHLSMPRLLQTLHSNSDDEDEDGVIGAPKDNPLLIMGSVLSPKQQRLVDWNCELLQQLLRQIVARRNFLKNASKRIALPFMSELPKFGERILYGNSTTIPLDEMVEVINLPEFDVAAYLGSTDAKHVRLDATVVTQLRRYVTILASRYRDNPFHNFDHASHVAMSVSKLLTRIVAPDLASINDRHDNSDINSSLHLAHDMKDLHDHTYGITSDPLTQFSVVLSALFHDVDHRGIPNNILINEEPEMAARYRNTSVAEQNSIDISWEILMQPEFKALRDTISSEHTELRRFRQIIVNSVLATDIFDKELGALRKARWNKAFHSQKQQQQEAEVTPFGSGSVQKQVSFAMRNQPAFIQGRNDRSDVNRKATIVIEHLIQASDVAHTMQHWHIYQKWNECLFEEMYTAFQEGRLEKDPSEGWFKGELWFFDNYVIPLAKKLKECGVFGVSSDEYLDYATANRNEWAEKGEAIVEQMLSKHKGVVDRSALGYE